MKEYSGKNADKFYWTPSNFYLINPALDRVIPPAKRGNKLLDVGCGHGDYYPLAQDKGYTYVGIDAAPAMLRVARKKYPEGRFLKLNAKQISQRSVGTGYQIILCNMLFSSFQHLSDISLILKNLQPLLSRDGMIVVTIAHPAYDGYMQHGILHRADIQARFTGYFAAGSRYQVRPPGMSTPFTDYHRTLSEYFMAAAQAKLSVKLIDECKPASALKKVDKKYYENKITYPSYLVLGLMSI